MILQLSNNSPRNAILRTPEGQAIYRIVTPKHLGARTTEITKIVPNSKDDDMQDRFAPLVQIDWPVFGKPVLRFQGQDIPSQEYLKSDGFLGR